MDYVELYHKLEKELEEIMSYSMSDPANIKLAADVVVGMKKAAMLADKWNMAEVDIDTLKGYHDMLQEVVSKVSAGNLTPVTLAVMDNALEAILSLRCLLGIRQTGTPLYSSVAAMATVAPASKESNERIKLMGDELEGFMKYKQSYRQTGEDADRSMMFQELDHFLANTELLFKELYEQANGAGERNMIGNKIRDLYAIYN